MIAQQELTDIYRQYGFEEEVSGEEGVYVYTFRSGHFHNADIIPVKENACEEKVFSDFKDTGYACKIRKYSNINEVKEKLFKGFFTVENTKKRLLKEYNRFCDSIVKIHSDDAKYSYIKSKYYIDGKIGNKDVVSEISNRLSVTKPILFLIEAAAGFGKTCTAYELLERLIEEDDLKIPLFSELSRNRQAKIFRYVLLDEIDRSFPLLSSSLVKYEIMNGNVPVILDGFDELLHRSEDREGYENTEPMLETIGELLKNEAKVILTTRRTAVFDGDDFHDWMDTHNEDFNVVRIRINEPTVTDWLPSKRLEILQNYKFPIEKLSNPVLLSYLRCISNDDFVSVVGTPDKVVEKYFLSMLERERVRQDLRILPSDQYNILKSIAKDMIDLNYTSENREYIINVIETNHLKILDEVRNEYSPDERPTSDEILNKLASHALLDKSSESNNIGFVNEFVLGTFCSDIILDQKDGEWAGNERFVEPAVLAYTPRSEIRKNSLWIALKFCLEFVEFSQKIDCMVKLTGAMDLDFEKENIENISFYDMSVANKSVINQSVFVNCRFSGVHFFSDNIKEVTFVNCDFHDCKLINRQPLQDISFLGCRSSSTDFQTYFTPQKKLNIETEKELKSFSQAEKYILEKYWPVGRQTFIKHRPIKLLCANANRFSHADIIDAINKLKEKLYLVEAIKGDFLALNIEMIKEIKSTLGRD